MGRLTGQTPIIHPFRLFCSQCLCRELASIYLSICMGVKTECSYHCSCLTLQPCEQPPFLQRVCAVSHLPRCIVLCAAGSRRKPQATFPQNFRGNCTRRLLKKHLNKQHAQKGTYCRVLCETTPDLCSVLKSCEESCCLCRLSIFGGGRKKRM